MTFQGSGFSIPCDVTLGHSGFETLSGRNVRRAYLGPEFTAFVDSVHGHVSPARNAERESQQCSAASSLISNSSVPF